MSLRALLLTSVILTSATATAVEVHEADLVVEGQVVQHYALHTPAEPTAKRSRTDAEPRRAPGLIVCFHEHVGPENDEVVNVSEALERLNLSDDYVVVGPMMKEARQDGKRVDQVIAYARQTWPINPRRIFIWGRGSGANFAGTYALRHPETFAGAVLFSWGFDKAPTVSEPQKTMPDFFYVLGLKDLDTHVTVVRSTYGVLRDAGYKVIYREVAELGGRTNHAPTNDAAITWLHQTRHKTHDLAREEIAALKPYANGSATRAEKDPEVFPTIIAVGGPQAGSLIPAYFTGKNESVRVAAIDACTQALFGDEVMTALAKQLDDKSARIRTAAIAALTYNATVRSAAAAKSLSDLALDTKADASDRGKAVDALIRVLTPQCAGAFQDVDLFAALVTLLEDRNATVRGKAGAFLAPLRPDAPNDTIAGWKAWVEGLRGKTGVGKHTGPVKK